MRTASNRQPATSNRGRGAAAVRSLLIIGLAGLLAVVTFALPSNTGSASAHPLGNFSINRLSVIEVSESGVTLTYLVDMAEIPTFQARGELDPDGDGVLSLEEQGAYLDATAPRLIENLRLAMTGERVPLDVVDGAVALLEGQGGLHTARLSITASGALPEGWQDGATVTYEDRNFRGTNGWRQVIVRPGDGVDLFETSAPAEDVTRGLTVYPQELLQSAPAVTSASFGFRAGDSSVAAVARVQPAGEAVARDEANKTLGRFASLVATENLTPAVILLGLLLSAAWGAMHALGPGHGKTVVAAYLVGERGTGRHAVYLGLIVTATHTISVFALGAIAIFASSVIDADDVYFWLSLGSGLLVATLGGALLLGRVRRMVVGLRTRGRATAMHSHVLAHGPQATLHVVMPGSRDHSADHGHGHEHAHGEHAHGDHDYPHDHDGASEHGHSHLPSRPGWRGIVALGVAGGIVPCPTALVVMLGAIALDRAVYGLVMVTAFSAGLAGVLTGIGLLMVYGKRWLEGRRLPLLSGAILRRAQLVAPVLSALTIFGLGLGLAGRALL